MTTHEMAEADALAERIVIISKGELCCVGNSISLKHKFSEGLKLSINLF
jgi:ABC-type multidrug transport system ATPase subunit